MCMRWQRSAGVWQEVSPVRFRRCFKSRISNTASSKMVDPSTHYLGQLIEKGGGQVFGSGLEGMGAGFRVRPLNPLFVTGFHYAHALI